VTKYELTRCIVCAEADAEQIAGPEDIRAEAELLWQFHMRRLSPRTPPERLVDRVAFSQPPPWRVVRCRRCGLVYRNPTETREVLRETYTEEAPPRETLLSLHHAQRAAYRAQAKRIVRGRAWRGTGLEVGSYVGAFLAASRQLGWNFEGLDVNRHTNAFVRSLGYTVHDGDLENFQSDRVYDCVAIWNTFDQLPDPRAAARAAWRILRPGGVLAIRVPNGKCYARWRSRLTSDGNVSRAAAVLVLAHNNLLTFPYRFGFSPESLARLLRESGFHVWDIVGDVLVPTRDKWTRRWARVEASVVKPLTRRSMPWFEVYATRGSGRRSEMKAPPL
jgi:SAM-dependent methyltransferase